MINENILLEILSKFPTIESRNELKNILLNSSNEGTWIHDISHICYIIDNLQQGQQQQGQVPQQQIPQPQPEKPQAELTDIEKIQLNYKNALQKIQDDKNNEFIKYRSTFQ